MNNEKKYNEFELKDKAANYGGGEDKLQKQRESGKMTARERIDTLLDKGTFCEFDKFVTHRCTNFGMDKTKIHGDGVVSG